MPKFGLLIRCIGHAVAAQGLKCLMGLVPFGERLYEIACDAHERFKQGCCEEEALAQVEAAVQATSDEVRIEAREAFTQVRAAAAPEAAVQLARPELEKGLIGYLEQIPLAIRTTLRRPADPTGRSIPRNFSLRKPEEFLKLLPQRPPRFRTGNRVLDGWILTELLGVGGFGEVWKAEHGFLSSQLPVALKFCLAAESVRYLKHEARLVDHLMSQGSLPGVVQLKHVYLDNDPPCIAYEFINGGDLCGLMHDWLRQPPEKRILLVPRPC